jgi:hypothetical protein
VGNNYPAALLLAMHCVVILYVNEISAGWPVFEREIDSPGVYVKKKFCLNFLFMILKILYWPTLLIICAMILINPSTKRFKTSIPMSFRPYFIGMSFDEVEHYQFFTKGLREIDIYRAQEFTKAEFKELVRNGLQNFSDKLSDDLLAEVLTQSERYQLDPFWVLAVMQVESHFNPIARSHMGAQGMMQLLPETAGYLAKALGEMVQDLNDPHYNVRMGTFYLRYLLTKLRGSYRLSTIAYNIGPGNLYQQLRTPGWKSQGHDYLEKVLKAHQSLSVSFVLKLALKPASYTHTYVYRYKSDVSARDLRMTKLITTSSMFANIF